MILSASAALVLSSCAKFLEETSQDEIKPSSANDYLELIAGEIYYNTNQTPVNTYLDIMTDDCEEFAKDAFLSSDNRNEGFGYYTWQASPEHQITGTLNSDQAWAFYYHQILVANMILYDIDKMSGSDQEKAQVKAEAYMIRAFAYYRLIRVYGGVVLRTELDGPEQNDKPRSTEADSWKQVIDDLKYAATYLPDQPVQSGRLSKAAAYAMLTRVGLYYGRFDPEGWSIAIDAANECARYSSLSTGDDGYADVFANASNKENIFVINYSPGEIYHRADQYFRPSGDAAVYGATITSSFFPTSELVDSYEMADGSEFSWNVNGDDPYSGREPRFYATILYNGAEWEGREIETYEGGADGIISFPHNTGASGTTITGYYMKKWLTEGSTDWIINGSTHFYVMLRYGEVLLNKAEALAQQNWAENSEEALQCLNDIRARVGLPARSATSLDEFMELLRQERKVELAGEGFRYWDLRRWRMAEDVIQNQQAHGCWITKDPDDGTLSYSQVEVDGGKTRVFLERYYAFSIPEVERSNNALLGENNKGW